MPPARPDGRTPSLPRTRGLDPDEPTMKRLRWLPLFLLLAGANCNMTPSGLASVGLDPCARYLELVNRSSNPITYIRYRPSGAPVREWTSVLASGETIAPNRSRMWWPPVESCGQENCYFYSIRATNAQQVTREWSGVAVCEGQVTFD
jgi:hypothetical protein